MIKLHNIKEEKHMFLVLEQFLFFRAFETEHGILNTTYTTTREDLRCH